MEIDVQVAVDGIVVVETRVDGVGSRTEDLLVAVEWMAELSTVR